MGRYFDKMPADPFTGRPFQYFPQGRPDRLKEIRPWDRSGYYDQKIYLAENKPFLWSPGREVADSGADEPLLRRYLIRTYPNSARMAHYEDEIWQCGLIFPLP